MESIIVRVYRRSRTKPDEVSGLVETVGADERRAFQSFTGLIEALRNAIPPADDAVIDQAERYAYTISNKKQAG
jgi:hypothetical protein